MDSCSAHKKERKKKWTQDGRAGALRIKERRPRRNESTQNVTPKEKQQNNLPSIFLIEFGIWFICQRLFFFLATVYTTGDQVLPHFYFI